MIRCLKCMQVFDEEYEVCPHCGQVAGAPPEIAFHLYPGTILNNKYVIGTALGHGGFGITYNAWDQTLNTHVAVKEYFPSGLVNRIPGTAEVLLLSGEKEKQYYNGLNQFLNEARQTVAFSEHPNIVHVFDFFEENNTAYIVMEFLDGISLKDLLKQWDNKLDCDQAVDIGVSICDALTEIHKKGILHRDINPSNIFICLQGATKLIDFGSARISDDENEKTRSVIITPGYAPPEQYRSKSKQGSQTDIYALCAVLYRCVTGVKPIESLDRTVDDTLDSPMVINEEVPEWLDKIIMRGMALEPEIRFKSAAELKDALLNHAKVDSPQEKIKKRRKLRLVQIASAVAVIFAAACGVGLWHYHNRVVSLADMDISGAELTFWVPSDKAECFETAAERFEKTYSSKITANVVSVPADEYAEKLRSAPKDDSYPDVFFTDGLGKDDMKLLADISIVYDSLPMTSYIYLPEYRTFDNASYEIPLGYDEAAVFINKSLSGLSGDKAVTEFTPSEYKADENSKGFAADTDFLQFTGKNSDISVSDKAITDFARQDAALLLTGASRYKKIQEECSNAKDMTVSETVAGNYYAVPVIEDGKACGIFTDKVGVSVNSSEKEKQAAELLITFLLTEQSQDIIHIQNSGSLPLQSEAFERFTEYNNLITFIDEQKDNIDFSKDRRNDK